MKRTSFLWFLLGSLLLCLFVFRDGLWGGSLLAPLDVMSNLYPKYRFLDPNATGIPANSHIIDQVDYDLPLQRTIYQSYRQGEMPWWDPYTCGGRPFLADAHISAVDPVRLLWYRVLPFELAYNWTLVTHFLLGGVAMFFLLRHYAFGQWICFWLAMAYEFAGCNAWYFGHPWIHAAFVYYPFLWWLWEKGLERPARWRMAVAPLVVAAMLMAGNLQSHAYIIMFAATFCAGHGWTSRREWNRALRIVAPGLIVGGCLAMPFLSAEIEFFLNSLRAIGPAPRLSWLGGIAALATVYPWVMGTFRTLDLGKFIRQDGAGFVIYIGSVATVLALLACVEPAAPARRSLKRKALALLVVYGIIVSSPLWGLFNSRCAGMAVLGLTVLAAIGAEELFGAVVAFRRVGWFVIGLSVILVVGLNLAALVIYPRMLPQVREFVMKRTATTVFGEEAQALREFQVMNLPREVSVRNPETVIAFVGLMCVGFVLLSTNIRRRALVQPALLALNLVPVLMFCGRFIPRQPMELWTHLLAGGPAQRKVADVLGNTELRLWEIAPTDHQKLFPYDVSHLYKVRTVHGYSALMPRCLFWLSATEQEQCRSQMADYVYESHVSGQPLGELVKNPTLGLARVQWKTSVVRTFQVEQRGLNEIHVHFDPGPAGALLWTDTHYPGWEATLDQRRLALQATPPTFTTMEIAENSRELILRYRPTYLLPSMAVSIGAIVLIASFLLWEAVLRRRPKAVGHG